MKEDIYGRERHLKNSLEALRNCEDMPIENKSQILKFYHQCVADGLSTARILKYLSTLRKISSMLKKPFEQANKDDIVKLVEQIEHNKNWSDWTKHHYRITLKKFYKWLRGYNTKGIYPEEVAWIRCRVKNGNNILPSEILTEEEIQRLATIASHPRDKALVLVFYESGCRVGELLTLKIKQVTFDDYGAVLFVTGKTGDRRIRIIASAPALASWLDIHPFKDNPEAYVWLSLATNRKDQPLNYRGLYKLFKILAKKAKIKKKVNPHSFRHARATHLANKLTEQQLKMLFGWTQASKMASVYVHLSGRDVDNALLELHGLKPSQEKEMKIRVKICPKCQERNSPDAIYCKRCASTIDAQAMEWENRMMDQLTKNPQVSRYLRKMLRQMLIKEK